MCGRKENQKLGDAENQGLVEQVQRALKYLQGEFFAVARSGCEVSQEG